MNIIHGKLSFLAVLSLTIFMISTVDTYITKVMQLLLLLIAILIAFWIIYKRKKLF